MFDTGWSCREHTVLTGVLLAAEGVASDFVFGANMFIVGPSSEGASPYGVGNDAPQSTRGHSWLLVPGFGVIDISPRLNERFPSNPRWQPIMAKAGRLGDTWLVDGRPGVVVEAADFAEYGQEIPKATHVVDGYTAVYWQQETLPFSIAMVEADWVDSPLRTRVKASDFEGALLRAGTHLWALNKGLRRPLATVSQSKAWRFVSEIDDTLVDEFTDAVLEGLGHTV